MKSRLEKSMEYIKGYCEKHSNCADCNLKDQEAGCCMIEGKVPCDWEPEKYKKLLHISTKYKNV